MTGGQVWSTQITAAIVGANWHGAGRRVASRYSIAAGTD